jgi:hypothetical protein
VRASCYGVGAAVAFHVAPGRPCCSRRDWRRPDATRLKRGVRRVARKEQVPSSREVIRSSTRITFASRYTALYISFLGSSGHPQLHLVAGLVLYALQHTRASVLPPVPCLPVTRYVSISRPGKYVRRACHCPVLLVHCCSQARETEHWIIDALCCPESFRKWMRSPNGRHSRSRDCPITLQTLRLRPDGMLLVTGPPIVPSEAGQA